MDPNQIWCHRIDLHVQTCRLSNVQSLLTINIFVSLHIVKVQVLCLNMLKHTAVGIHFCQSLHISVPYCAVWKLYLLDDPALEFVQLDLLCTFSFHCCNESLSMIHHIIHDGSLNACWVSTINVASLVAIPYPLIPLTTGAILYQID